MFGWYAPSAMNGLFTETQNVMRRGVGHFSQHRSTYNNNNGATRLQFSVDSYLPTHNAQTVNRAHEFAAIGAKDDFIRSMYGMHQGGAIQIPFNGFGEFITPWNFPTTPDFYNGWANFFNFPVLQRPF